RKSAEGECEELRKRVGEVGGEHGAVLRALPNDGIAVLNRDDPHFAYWAGVAGKRGIWSFGTAAEAAVRGTYRLAPAASAIEIEFRGARHPPPLRPPRLHTPPTPPPPPPP